MTPVILRKGNTFARIIPAGFPGSAAHVLRDISDIPTVSMTPALPTPARTMASVITWGEEFLSVVVCRLLRASSARNVWKGIADTLIVFLQGVMVTRTMKKPDVQAVGCHAAGRF